MWWVLGVSSKLRFKYIGSQPPQRLCRIGARLDSSIGPCPGLADRRLVKGAIGESAPPADSAGVWHTHNLSAVRQWLSKGRGTDAVGAKGGRGRPYNMKDETSRMQVHTSLDSAVLE